MSRLTIFRGLFSANREIFVKSSQKLSLSRGVIGESFCSCPSKRLSTVGPSYLNRRLSTAAPIPKEKEHLDGSNVLRMGKKMTLSQENELSTDKKNVRYLYQNDENMNVEKFFKTSSAYQDTFFREDPSVTEDDGVRKFIEATMHPDRVMEPIVSDKNTILVQNVLENLHKLTDQDLFLVLFHMRKFAPCSSVDDPRYAKIWSRLDTECLQRMSGWSLEKCFQASDLWYGIKLVRFSRFHQKLLVKCVKDCATLSKEHFVRFLYSLNLARTLPTKFTAYEIEGYLNQRLNRKWLPEEVVIVAMACFKTEMTLKNPHILETLLDIGIAHRKQLNSISVAAIAKFARFSSSDNQHQTILKVQEAFVSEVDRLSLLACTHLTLIGTKTHLPYMPLITAVSKKAERNIKDARLKELERIALVMTTFDVDCDGLYDRIVQELRSSERANEVKEYGRCLPAILHYLSTRNIFPFDLIDTVLSEKFRQRYYANSSDDYLRELASLDFCAELEMTGYTGARLDEELRTRVFKSHILRVQRKHGQRVSNYEKTLNSAMNTLRTRFPKVFKSSAVINLLPQHQCTKIVICTDKDGNPQEIPQSYLQLPEHAIKYPCLESQFHVLYICSRNDRFANESRLTGPGKSLIRQLEKMGYFVHVVFFPMSQENLSQLISNVCKPKVAS